MTLKTADQIYVERISPGTRRTHNKEISALAYFKVRGYDFGLKSTPGVKMDTVPFKALKAAARGYLCALPKKVISDEKFKLTLISKLK